MRKLTTNSTSIKYNFSLLRITKRPSYRLNRIDLVGITDVFGVPAIGSTAGASEGAHLGSAGLFGATTLLGCLFRLLDFLRGGFLHSLLDFLHGFLRGLLGGFLRCFLRHNNSPESRGLETKHKQGYFAP